MKECVKDCEFLDFKDSGFRCSYYNENLDFNHDISSITVLRCRECKDDNVIGTNTDNENARKIKKYLGWMADSFFSHKDEFESSLTEIYRIIRHMEESKENEKAGIFKDKNIEG